MRTRVARAVCLSVSGKSGWARFKTPRNTYPSKTIMQTETECGNRYWKPGFDPDGPQNSDTSEEEVSITMGVASLTLALPAGSWSTIGVP